LQAVGQTRMLDATLKVSGGNQQIISAVNVGPVGSGTPRQMQFLLRLDF
jgi:hypothetical protein